MNDKKLRREIREALDEEEHDTTKESAIIMGGVILGIIIIIFGFGIFSSTKLEGTCSVNMTTMKLTNNTYCWEKSISNQACPVPQTASCSFKADISEYSFHKILNGLKR